MHLEALASQDSDIFADVDSASPNLTDSSDRSSERLNRLNPPLVVTPHVRRAVDSFRCWLDDSRSQQSFLLVGPEGSGKR